MAYIEPSTQLKFLTGIPFDPSYENTMYFDSYEQQRAYMQEHVMYAFYNYSYQRKGKGVIRVGWIADVGDGHGVIANIYNANYMEYKNDNFENKWFYAFVDKVEYVNNNTADVYYHIDVIQTWHFEYSFNQCLIERQHLMSDIPGNNTIPEGLETGEYMLSSQLFFNLQPCVIVETTQDANGNYIRGAIYPGRTDQYMSMTYSGHGYIKFVLPTDIEALNDYLEGLKEKVESVVAIYLAYSDFTVQQYPSVHTPAKTMEFGRQANIGSYTPRNKKLLTWPYVGLYANNFQGQALVMPFEYFADPLHCVVELWGTFTANPGLIFYPDNYKGSNGPNFDEAIMCNGFPLCSWSYDTFKAWLAQNAGYIAASAVTVGVNAISAATGDTTSVIPNAQRFSQGRQSLVLDYDEQSNAGGWGGVVSQAAHLLGGVRDQYVKPPTSGANAQGSLLQQAGLLNVMVGRKHIRPEYAQIIDGYFDMYGYKVNRVSIPNRNARPCYTYVKTVGCSIDGNLPNDDIRELEAIYNKGIRFWKPTAVFGNFDPAVNDNRV